jgi:hypothetical protein
MINIYTNGTINLVDLSNTVLSSLQSNCSYNTTNGLIFTRNFYDNFFFLLCSTAPALSQYLIRDNQFLFNRIIPLYGFTTRTGGNWQAGTNFLFV